MKKRIFRFLTGLMALTLFVTPVFASGRKIITKKGTYNFSIYSAYHYQYTVTASAILTYNNSNTITQISDLSLNTTSKATTYPTLSASFTANQKSKSFTSSQAKYVVTVTRNVYGYYTDKVDYTFTYKVTDAGNPYSLNKEEVIDGVLVSVEEGDPYDIQILKPVLEE